MKTIGRNQKKKAETIFANAENIKGYTLDNYFIAKPCLRLDYRGESWLRRMWYEISYAKLIEKEPGKYQLHIHSNCWYEFEVKC